MAPSPDLKDCSRFAPFTLLLAVCVTQTDRNPAVFDLSGLHKNADSLRWVPGWHSLSQCRVSNLGRSRQNEKIEHDDTVFLCLFCADEAKVLCSTCRVNTDYIVRPCLPVAAYSTEPTHPAQTNGLVLLQPIDPPGKSDVAPTGSGFGKLLLVRLAGSYHTNEGSVGSESGQ